MANLTGRQVVMTYGGWVWSHGMDYKQVESDVRKMFKTMNFDLFKKYGVNYIVVDEHAQRKYGISKFLYLFRFKLIKTFGKVSIYQVN